MASNNYEAQYIPSDLLWYKRDGLMMWHDQTKCKDFLRAPKNHFKNRKIVNFDIIRKQAAREKVPNETVKKYQMAKEEDLRISQKTAREFFLMLLRQRGQIFILKETSLGTILNVSSV